MAEDAALGLTEFTVIPLTPTDAATAVPPALDTDARSVQTEREVAQSTCAVPVAHAAFTAGPPAPVTDAALAPRACIAHTDQDKGSLL
jgi:hypothetical protein